MIIKKVNYGLASMYGDTLEYHKALDKPENNKLKTQIIDHELGHTKSKYVTWRDMLHDFTDVSIGMFASLKFMIKNPSSLNVVFPISYQYSDKSLSFCPSWFINWLSIVVLFSIFTENFLLNVLQGAGIIIFVNCILLLLYNHEMTKIGVTIEQGHI